MNQKKAAIYHFTDKSIKRPKIYLDQLKELEAFANSMGFYLIDIYCDKSLKVCEHTEFKRFLSCCDSYDALFIKSFYHISKNTHSFISTIRMLLDKGLQIYSIENGIIFFEDFPFDKTLKVATYTCHSGTANEFKEIVLVNNDILSLFAAKKTNWKIIDQFYDRSSHQNNGEQIQIMELIKNRTKYDLLLVRNLNDIHWRTSNFCKIREKLHLDIFSLQDGLLKYRK